MTLRVLFRIGKPELFLVLAIAIGAHLASTSLIIFGCRLLCRHHLLLHRRHQLLLRLPFLNGIIV